MALYQTAQQTWTADLDLRDPAAVKARVFHRSGDDATKEQGDREKGRRKQVYALLCEVGKWRDVLDEVVQRSGVCGVERKLTPKLAALLAFDLLLSKTKKLAAPASHPLSLAIARHRARLSAELTRARVRRGFGSLDALRTHLEREAVMSGAQSPSSPSHDRDERVVRHPRWVRINTLRTDIKRQLETTFSAYDNGASLEDVLAFTTSSPHPASQGGQEQRDAQIKPPLRIDAHVQNLIALPLRSDVTKTSAYQRGEVILQDKASCFPAELLLDQDSDNGDIIDACAAPGNKTSHTAALLHSSLSGPGSGIQKRSSRKKRRLFAFERDPKRAEVLKRMLRRAGVWGRQSEHAGFQVDVRAGSDFLATDPQAAEFAGVTKILLDPSCSGSGIVGRYDDNGTSSRQHVSRKATKVQQEDEEQDELEHEQDASDAVSKSPPTATHPLNGDETRSTSKRKRSASILSPPPSPDSQLHQRLANLSAFQVRLLTHAMRFPAATRITYSTCSIHVAENEDVVRRALHAQHHEHHQRQHQQSHESQPQEPDPSRSQGLAAQKSWRILRRDEQPDGLRKWLRRGTTTDAHNDTSVDRDFAEACIRCAKDGDEGTMGFFVACLVRDDDQSEECTAVPVASSSSSSSSSSSGSEHIDEHIDASVNAHDEDDDDGEEWAGFED